MGIAAFCKYSYVNNLKNAQEKAVEMIKGEGIDHIKMQETRKSRERCA